MAKKELETGMEAPAFSLPDQSGETVSLKDFAGKWVVLYFYPKDSTSGCTTEALDFTAARKEFESLNAVVIGVSPDSCQSHQKFILKYDLGIILLSDTERKVLGDYGVWQKKKQYGKEYMGVVRSTFLIDPKGTVARSWRKVSVKGHAEEVLAELRELAD